MFIEAMDHSHGAYLKTFMLAFDTIKNLVAKYLSVRRCQAAWVHKETATTWVRVGKISVIRKFVFRNGLVVLPSAITHLRVHSYE